MGLKRPFRSGQSALWPACRFRSRAAPDPTRLRVRWRPTTGPAIHAQRGTVDRLRPRRQHARASRSRRDRYGRVEIGLLGRVGVSVEADRLFPAGHEWRGLWSAATEPEAGSGRALPATEICTRAKARTVRT